jgi:hypothetical protein
MSESEIPNFLLLALIHKCHQSISDIHVQGNRGETEGKPRGNRGETEYL